MLAQTDLAADAQLHTHGAHRRRRVRTTVRSPEAAPAPDNLNRRFSATRPDEVWLANITYIWTRECFLYLAAVVDVFTRQVVSWAMANHLQTQLVIPHYDPGGTPQPRLSSTLAPSRVHSSELRG